MNPTEKKTFATLKDSARVNYAARIVKDIHDYAVAKQEEVDKYLSEANVGVCESRNLKMQAVFSP